MAYVRKDFVISIHTSMIIAATPSPCGDKHALMSAHSYVIYLAVTDH